MKTDVVFPKWLPKNVADHCRAKLQSGALSESQQQCIIRLVTNEAMRSVWSALQKHTSTSSELVDFIEFVRLHPTIFSPKLETIKLTRASQRKAMTQIRTLTERLIATLAQLDAAASDPNRGVALLKSEIDGLQKQAVSKQEAAAVVHLHQLLAALEAADEEVGIIEMLKLLQNASKLAIDAPPGNGPRKQGAKTAPRTLFIKGLKGYMRLHFNEPLNQAIANTVIVAMDLPPESVTEDLVRKA